MLKSVRRGSFYMVLIMATFLLSSCFGSMTITKKVYKFNQSIENKYVRSGVFWLMFLGVWEVCGAADVLVLNVIEFWTGENPLAVAEGPIIKEVIGKDGKRYQVTINENRYTVINMESNKKIDYVFDPKIKEWSVYKDDKLSFKGQLEGDFLAIISPDNKEVQRLELELN